MKIFQINVVAGIGSTGRIVIDLHNVLREQKHESYIAFGRDTSRYCDEAIRIGNKFNIFFHVAKTRLFDKHGFGSKSATIDLIKKIKNLNPDVIHLHNIHGYYINIELLFDYLKKINKPVVWTLHDCWAFTGHCSHFDYIVCDKWKVGCEKCPQKQSYPSSFLLDNSRSNFIKKKELFTGLKNMVIVTPSQWLAKLVKESFLNEYNVKVINNGIDLDVFKPTESNFRVKYDLKDKFIILGVATDWVKRKGYDYFIDLSNKIKQDEIIVLVGVTEEQKKLLPDNIIGITRTNNTKEMAEIYSAGDVFINPTLEDNFPTTNLEALACGTPVITFNTGGSVESVDESSGIIVEKGNLHELINAISICKEKKINKDDCLERSLFYNKNDRFNEYVRLYVERIN